LQIFSIFITKNVFGSILLTFLVSPKELERLYSQFNHMDLEKQGFLTPESFCKGFSFGDMNISKNLFRLFDENHDGKVDFKDFMNAMSVLLRGDAATQLTCITCTLFYTFRCVYVV
jgi:Ca2+-binding EF-hand superfamily protein